MDVIFKQAYVVVSHTSDSYIHLNIAVINLTKTVRNCDLVNITSSISGGAHSR